MLTLNKLQIIFLIYVKLFKKNNNYEIDSWKNKYFVRCTYKQLDFWSTLFENILKMWNESSTYFNLSCIYLTKSQLIFLIWRKQFSKEVNQHQSCFYFHFINKMIFFIYNFIDFFITQKLFKKLKQKTKMFYLYDKLRQHKPLTYIRVISTNRNIYIYI